MFALQKAPPSSTLNESSRLTHHEGAAHGRGAHQKVSMVDFSTPDTQRDVLDALERAAAKLLHYTVDVSGEMPTKGKSGTRSRNIGLSTALKEDQAFVANTKAQRSSTDSVGITLNDNVGCPTAFGASSSCFVCKCKAMLPGCRFMTVVVGGWQTVQRHLSTFGSR
jgi:hypothetical protein